LIAECKSKSDIPKKLQVREVGAKR